LKGRRATALGGGTQSVTLRGGVLNHALGAAAPAPNGLLRCAYYRGSVQTEKKAVVDSGGSEEETAPISKGFRQSLHHQRRGGRTRRIRGAVSLSQTSRVGEPSAARSGQEKDMFVPVY